MREIFGMIVPLATALTEDHEVDVPSLRSLCRMQISAGINGLFVLGTTGEFYALTGRQRRRVVDTVLAAVGGKVPVLAGITGDSTASAVEALRDCRDDEIAGYVAGTAYLMEYSQEELADYFRALADAVGEPIILYNFPQRYRNVIAIDTIAKLLANGCVFGIKDTGGDFDYLRRLLDLKKSFPSFRVFEGALANLGRSGRLGIDGSVQALGNLLPMECAALWTMIGNKDWSTLQAEVDKMWTFHQEIETVAPFIASLKGCMALRGWCRAVVGRPARPVGREQTARLEEMMTRTYPHWKATS